MKKTGTMASLVLAGAMACSYAFADNGTTRSHEAVHVGGDAVMHLKASQSKLARQDKKKFVYLDMVQRKHPQSIRNAVIVYEHLGMKKRACDANDAKSVSECLGSPST